MLHLCTGLDRVRISDRLMEVLCRAAGRGEAGQILIVPEQFSHEAERRLCAKGGDSISRYAEVLSLSRLADRVASVHGGVARAYLDKGGRILAMALAAEQAASKIKLYAAVLRRPEFLVDMVRMIEEFQSYCLEPQVLLDASRQAEGTFAQKLEELGLLYESYLAVCGTGQADPAGKLLGLKDALLESGWARGKTFYIDCFSDFTGAELSVLEALLTESEDLWVALPVGEAETAVTRPVRETAKALRTLAARWEVSCKTEPVLEHTDRDPGVQGLLDHLFTAGEQALPPSAHVCLRSFSSVEEECRAAALYVKSLLTQGVRCREISVACTDVRLYEAPLRAAFQAADLPFYFAGETDVLCKPILGAVLSALSAATGPMDYEDVALYLKSGLPPLERDRCDRLDLYAYLWNLHGGQWERPWELHPRGFGEPWTEDDEAALAQLNQDKDQALGALFTLRSALRACANTGDMVLAFYDFLEALDLRRRLEAQANQRLAQGQGQAAQELLQLYEILRQSLEQTWLILGKTPRTPEDFFQLYRTLLTQYRVGTIPAGLDQVYISALPDLRQRTTAHLLVLGASDGSFPAYQTGEGLLTEEERKHLLARGVPLAPCRADQMDREMSSIHTALSAATASIRLSYAGEQPAWLFRRAAALYPDSLRAGAENLPLDLPSLAAWRIRHGDQSPLDLPNLDRVEAGLRQLRDYQFEPLSKETVRGLYGRQIYLSASRIDKYAACRFAFFLTYGLKAKPRRQAKLDPSVFGTFVHAVLQETVGRVMDLGGFRAVSQETLLEIATEEINRYAQENFPRQAERAAYLFRRNQAEILDIVLDLGDELRASLFQPAACELEFSANGAMPPIEIEGEEASCLISGFVDRVDLYEHEGRTYVRVVDYKTGRKDFDYTDILNGAGLQMLVYLFALRQYGGDLFQAEQLDPAGVLYLPARKDYTLMPPMPDEEAVAEKRREERRRKGLILSDEALLSAMEADPEHPRFMPYKAGKNGPTGDLADRRQMILLERHVLRTLANMTDAIASGDVTPNPTVRGQDTPCRFCDYAAVCHGDLCPHLSRYLAATPAAMFWDKLEEEERHG